MTHSNEPSETSLWAARIVATILVVFVLGCYTFPWAVPFIWDMPEGTTAPYYGILIAIEVTRSVTALDERRKKIN
jgi:hypothetical protein